ncbi:MAG: YbaN family protein [Alphaproteobacteria bacterium]|nr:YbaN family protein [Alphaproteobacteria bacterium]
MSLATLRKPLLVTTGWMCVALGMLGIIMPLFPTTPFLLVAVWAFSKSSPELAEKIRNHRVAGPYIRDWQDSGVIPVKAKVLAVAMMSAMIIYLHFGAKAPTWATVVAAGVLLAISTYILTRPSKRPAT